MPPSPEAWQDAQGSASVTLLAPHVIKVELKQIVTQSIGDKLASALERQITSAREPVHTALDLWELENYDTAVRVECTRVIKTHASRILSVHALSRSQLVRMGVSVANLALGGIVKSYKDRASFDRVVSNLVHRR